jgi:hypothetical protein
MDEHFCPVLAVALLYEYANNLASINNLSLNFCLILIAVTAV